MKSILRLASVIIKLRVYLRPIEIRSVTFHLRHRRYAFFLIVRVDVCLIVRELT